MRELTSPRWIIAKGLLFLLAGILSGILLLVEARSWTVAMLLLISIWCCARFYYFAFYVIEHYVDPSYRFSGLGSFAQYLWSRRHRGRAPSGELLAEARQTDAEDHDR